MRKLGTGVVVLVALAAAGYGIYWYQVKRQVDGLVQRLSPFAQIRYESIHLHPDGTVGVDGLIVTPHQLHAPVSIETVRLRAGGPLYFLTGAQSPPKQLDISLRQVRQGLDSAPFRELQRQSDLMLESNPLYVSPAALGCGGVRQFDTNTLRRMGLSEWVMDLDLDYRVDTKKRRGRLNLLADLQGLAQLQIKMEFSADPSQLQNPMMASGNARLETLSFSYADQGYNQRRDRFCAAEAGVEPAEYRQRHRQLFMQWLQAGGVELPDNLLAAYFELRQPSAEMALSLRSPGGVGMAEVMLQEPVALLQSLDAQLSINDKPQPFAGIDWPALAAELARAGKPGRVGAVAEAEAAEKDKAAPAQPRFAAAVAASQRPERGESKRYRPTPLQELPAYVGAPVRIFTYFGNDVEGQLVHADKQGIRVIQRLEQGFAEYPLENDLIQQAEVLR